MRNKDFLLNQILFETISVGKINFRETGIEFLKIILRESKMNITIVGEPEIRIYKYIQLNLHLI